MMSSAYFRFSGGWRTSPASSSPCSRSQRVICHPTQLFANRHTRIVALGSSEDRLNRRPVELPLHTPRANRLGQDLHHLSVDAQRVVNVLRMVAVADVVPSRK